MDRRTYIILFFSGLFAGALVVAGTMYHLIGKSERAGYKEGYTAGQVAGGTMVRGASSDASGAVPIADPALARAIPLSRIEIAKHANPASCWLLIGGKVYDVTPYIEAHPGGAAEILANCGKDATEAFASKGAKGAPHSADAEAMLGSFLLGALDANVPAAAISVASGGTATATPTIPKSAGDDDNDDDDEREFEDD